MNLKILTIQSIVKPSAYMQGSEAIAHKQHTKRAITGSEMLQNILACSFDQRFRVCRRRRLLLQVGRRKRWRHHRRRRQSFDSSAAGRASFLRCGFPRGVGGTCLSCRGRSPQCSSCPRCRRSAARLRDCDVTNCRFSPARNSLEQWFSTASPVKSLGVPRKNAGVFSFNPQMHKQQQQQPFWPIT